jgi:hypothetical protein
MKLKRRIRFPIKWAVILVLLAGLAAFVATHLQIETVDRGTKSAAVNPPGAPKVKPGPEELPNEANFKTVGENARFRLKLDPTTAHFLIADKSDGRIWRSYPDPAQWSRETTTGLWRTHLRSPIMFQTIDLSGNKSQPKDSNWLDQNGTLQNLETFDGGFRVTFDMPAAQLTVPIEVKLEGDSVTTRIIDSGLKEGKQSLLWIRLYPFFGAERSEGQDGYMVIPDGSGAIISYDPNSTNTNRIYSEPVYGEDLAFRTSPFDSPRQPVMMPIYGAKNENQSFLTVLEDGAEFAHVLASPSGVYSSYNWITAQNDYRSSFKQVTNREKNSSFITYNKNERNHSDRVNRYILLEASKSDYVGMAERYRNYLMERTNLQKLKPRPGKVPMDITIIGADSASGLIWDRYLKGTTTSEAMRMVQRLYGLGIDNMRVRYWGWQKGGFGESGGLTNVDKRLGGDSGMRQFVDLAHSLDIPVFLRTDYLNNNTGAGGFSSRIHGVRDMGGTPIGSLASLSFVQKIVDRDIAYFKKLGVDGVELQGLGQFLNSDFNTKYGVTRNQARSQQQQLISKITEGNLQVIGYRSSFFGAPQMNAIASLRDDYSYDLFTKTGIPFAQIALHGLIPYSASPSNERDQFRQEFLHAIEYGENPAYQFTNEASDDLKYAENLYFYSPAYKNWEQTAVQEYQMWNTALGDVQDQFIVGHHILESQVRETTYENGKRIIVNYGVTPYNYEGKTVNPEDYLIVQGGAKP